MLPRRIPAHHNTSMPTQTVMTRVLTTSITTPSPSSPPRWRDTCDRRVAVELGVDYLALSFVRKAQDAATEMRGKAQVEYVDAGIKKQVEEQKQKQEQDAKKPVEAPAAPPEAPTAPPTPKQ